MVDKGANGHWSFEISYTHVCAQQCVGWCIQVPKCPHSYRDHIKKTNKYKINSLTVWHHEWDVFTFDLLGYVRAVRYPAAPGRIQTILLRSRASCHPTFLHGFEESDRAWKPRRAVSPTFCHWGWGKTDSAVQVAIGFGWLSLYDDGIAILHQYTWSNICIFMLSYGTYSA